MAFTRTMQTAFVSLFLLVTMVYTRSVDLGHEKHLIDPKLGDVTQGEPWTPEDMSEEDWFRCHGMSCDQWERMKHKLRMLKVLAAQGREEPRFSVLDQLAEEAEKYNITDSDDFDGCIWLSEEQIDEMLVDQGVTNKMMGPNHVINKRTVDVAVASGGFKRWPNGLVHFKFDGQHSLPETTSIRQAMDHIEANTCVRFQQLDTNEVYSDSHVVITGHSSGCHSFVGRQRFKPQQLNLQAACIYNFGVPVHELLHTLGMWHEMQRSDRDQYINVLYENIGAYATQFTKLNTDNTVEYDVNSVVHYAGKDGAINYKLNSMETKNPLYQRNMGQRVELSFNDAKSINYAYCSDTCNGQRLSSPCERGGYQDPNDCSRCMCPPGFAGRFCEHLAQSKSNCGGAYTLSSSNPSITIESPGYSSAEASYESFDECNWQIKGANGQKLQLEFVDQFGVYCSYNYQCFHWVEVQYELNKNTNGPRLCCRDRPTAVIVSESDEITVLFRANFTVGSKYNRRGFRARINLVGDPNAGPPAPTTTTTTPRPTTTTTPRTTTTTTPRPTTATSTTTTTQSGGNGHGECHRVDISIALDSSGSVGWSGWSKLRQFTKDILSRFELSPQCAQATVISIGNVAHVHSYLNEHYNNIDNIIDALPFRDEWTNTASAFKAMTSEIYLSRRGDRHDAPNIALLLTDGPSNKDERNTIPHANEARNTKNVQFITIGVGSEVSHSELFAITGNNSARNIYVNGFNDILQSAFQRNIFDRITAIGSGNTNNNMPDTTTTSSTTTTPTTTTSTTTTTTQPPNTGSQTNFVCNFENESNQVTWCGITQSNNDQFDWTITNSKTPSDETGPTRAQGGNYYIFIEASSPRVMGDKARIELPRITSSGQYCISFAYHMYGFHINSLTVNRIQSNGNRIELWRREQQQSTYWQTAHTTKTLSSGDRIEFVGERGSAFSGDIALDTIRVHPGRC